MLTIERTDQEIIICLPVDLEVSDIQRMLDYLSYKQAVKNSQATQSQIDELAKEVKRGWWEENKHRFQAGAGLSCTLAPSWRGFVMYACAGLPAYRQVGIR